MTVYLSLCTTIDDLIQRIERVKVFQEHWKLVATRLTILQHELSQRNTLADIRQLQTDIEQTFIAVDELLVSCTEKDVRLNGVTYRDLESLLIRLQLCLAQHHADLTDDYQTKVRILSNAYHEQQILVQKVFDETMKQRLETIEQDTKENTIEQLRLLREIHFNTIRLYLQGCTQLHKSVPLTGLTSDVVAKVAHTFYHISPEEQIQLQHQWQSYDLPLTRTFIQFKPDKSTSFERNESRRLLIESDSHKLQEPHSRKEPSNGIWERLVSAPYMMSMTERDRYDQEEDVSEENIIRTKRWIVLLGDPGSGKTSFTRWLVRHLSQTLLLNGQHYTDYGPLRIPILIRIGEFAEMIRQQPSLTLFDYIGKHTWMGKTIADDPSISLHDLSCALQDYIRHGQALIILDGLDEIPVSDQRSLIINVVENFVDTYVQTPTGASVFDNPHLSKLLDDPSRSGGNQLIVTSRIVGYHAAPLAGQFAHYTIRPMDMEHMKDFVDYWFFRVHQQIVDTLDLSIANQGEIHGEALKQELEKTENSGLLDVASNSCLMSFICSVAFSQPQGSPLPTQHIRLYEAIVNSMLTLWSSKRSSIPLSDVIRILSDIATYIHGHSASGLIHEEKMKDICIQSIKDSVSEPLFAKRNKQEIENQACEFVRIIREDVGILAARGESLYGFLHLTFQEYFTCLKLINVAIVKEEKLVRSDSFSEKKVRLVAHSLRRHANDPRFRVPIALALGKISLSWSQTDFNHFCLEFIQEDEPNCRLPLGAYMLINCGNDFVNYPSNDILFDALDHLMIAAGQHKWSVICPFLFDQITTSLRKLRNDVVSLWINNFLSRSPPHHIQTISAVCCLLEGKAHEFENLKWLDQSSCLMLQYLSSLDSENNEYAIDRLLVKITFSNHRLFPVNPITFKGYLITHEIELNSIPVILFPLIIILYGGLKRNDGTVVFDPFHIYRESTAVTPILIRFLSKLNHNRQDESITMVKEECLQTLRARIENQDVSPETVDICIATICLYGLDYVYKNVKIISNSLFHLCLSRFKYISMILRQFYFTGSENDHSTENETTKLISTMIEQFQHGESAKVRFLDLLNSLRSSLARLRSSKTSLLLKGQSEADKRVTLYLPNSLRKEDIVLHNLLSTDVQFHFDRKSCSLIHHFTKLFWILEHNDEYETQHRMAIAMDTIPKYLLFRNDEDPLFPFTFIPSHLQNLFLQLMKQKFIVICSNGITRNDSHHLHFGHILIECLMVLSNASCKRLTTLAALLTLLPWFRLQHLENFGSSLLWAFAVKDPELSTVYEITRCRPMNDETGQYMIRMEDIAPGNKMTGEERRTLIRDCIEQEHQRLLNALTENDGDNIKLYSASVSLAHICRWSEDERRLSLLNESVEGAMAITNKILRLDALCIIALYCQSDCTQIQISTGKSIIQEIEHQLNDIYPTLPLLLHAAIFIRCLSLVQYQQTIDECLQSLLNKFADNDQQDRQAVNEALSPYLRSYSFLSSATQHLVNTLLYNDRMVHNSSSSLKDYIEMSVDQSPSSLLLISNMYLVEIASDFRDDIVINDRPLCVSHVDLHTTSLFQFENPMLTVAQVLTISHVLSSVSSRNRSEQSEKLCFFLSNALHHVNLVEFKGRCLLEYWMEWENSNELSSFAYHAALLLANSDFWSIKTTTILCNLLCCENDRFRQRAEIILRSKSNDDIRTSSKLGLDVLLTLAMKRAYYEHTSPFVSLTLARMMDYVTTDVQSHLETFLWIERYRIHALLNKTYTFTKSKLLQMSHIGSFFSTRITIDVSISQMINRFTDDLIRYLCHLIIGNFSSFLEIDGDTISNAVLESHNQFVVSILILVGTVINYTDKTRALVIDTLINLLEISKNDEIRRAAVSALGYICDKTTYKILFKKLQMVMRIESNNFNYTDYLVCALISSYCHCVAVNNIDFDHDDIHLFRQLLQNFSENVFKAARTGLGRVLKDRSFLSEMLGCDYIQYYHALMDSTAYTFIYEVRKNSIDAVAEFIEQHPDLLSIFILELYNSIRYFTNDVLHVMTTDYYLVYGHCSYIEVADSLAVRMPAAFCAFIKDWHDGKNLKRALFYTSKQHNFPQRAACLTILSIFGELTVELCAMIIEALRDDPHIQNTCYKCLTRINSIEDDKAVLNLLFSYLKSKSMNVRYVAAKILLHLSQCSLISSSQVRTVLYDLMLDPSSNENLWLIQEQDNVETDCVYNYTGPLKDVIYSLLVQHLIGDVSTTIRRNELNEIDLNFVESEKASRLASCLYETKTKENLPMEQPSKKIKLVD